ncbi:MAG TPA: hypothetical protein VKP69_07130, partial [Isosphaeraceae bacterium]|nr:hypothetical protein [Isosphaeraceae bacterium]
ARGLCDIGAMPLGCVKLIAYCCVSTHPQGASGLDLGAQIETMSAYQIVRILRQNYRARRATADRRPDTGPIRAVIEEGDNGGGSWCRASRTIPPPRRLQVN